MRIVIDTNVLLSSISRKSQFRLIFDKILDNSITLAVSHDILLEYEEIIAKKSSPEVAANILRGFEDRPNIEYIDIFFNWNLIELDPDDNKFVDCYVASGAEYLVTNDHHFDILSPNAFPPVYIVSIEEFMEIIQTRFDTDDQNIIFGKGKVDEGSELDF
ncbi:MAG: putative toxin-antitoxin system toxin component, PIN family [Haliscomenobacteraceae bacterium CHB4]|nr:hypothetical protein [Saprospiraceae bacterium]MCE7926833.1 putative toxin-antitoxin system toxin component, PIN family [Haliscomenobacteraceae bacterium CHB4]